MKPLLELIEDYGEACYEHGRLGVTYAGEDAYDKSGELLAEIRARLEVMEREIAKRERQA